MSKSILIVIFARLILAFIITSYMLIFNLFMRKLGYEDDIIAEVNAWPHFMVLLLSLPVGLWIKGLPLKPFFMAALIFMPVGAWFLPDAISHHNLWLARLSYVSIGIGWMLSQVCALPFILRNGKKELESEGIALNYATFAAGMILSGLSIYLLSQWGSLQIGDWQIPWDEYHILKAFSLTSIPAIGLLLFLREKPVVIRSEHPAFKLMRRMKEYDWKLLGKALFPTTVIAVGAGLTIPFINLFFNAVFGVSSEDFGLIGMGASILVVISSLIVPVIRKKFGYKVAITLSQIMAVIMLILLALTELGADISGMVYLAVGFYMLRTPFMNMAAPMTSELTMNYVGPANQELMAALVSSIWSGSWFISAKIFQFLRAYEIPYYQIFFITCGFYIIGIYKYYRLIQEFERRPAD